MSVTTKLYVRKPFAVKAVQVTDENIKEIATWCKGEVKSETKREETRSFIAVPVHRPLNHRQTQAFIGDWILESEMGLKVYTQRAFEASFEESEGSLSIPEAPAIQLTQVKGE